MDMCMIQTRHCHIGDGALGGCLAYLNVSTQDALYRWSQKRFNVEPPSQMQYVVQELPASISLTSVAHNERIQVWVYSPIARSSVRRQSLIIMSFVC